MFRVFTKSGPKVFSLVEPAIGHAQELAGAEALQHALEAGAAQARVELSQLDNKVTNDIDGDMFFEARVTATASGPPLTRRHREAQPDAANKPVARYA